MPPANTTLCCWARSCSFPQNGIFSLLDSSSGPPLVGVCGSWTRCELWMPLTRMRRESWLSCRRRPQSNHCCGSSVVPGPAWPQRSLKPCIGAEVLRRCVLSASKPVCKLEVSSFQSASAEQGGRSETCRQVAATRPGPRNLIDRFDRVLEWSCYYCRGREGARGGERGREGRRRSLEVCGGDCCKQVLTTLASHDGDAKRSTSWLCRFHAPAATTA